MIIAGLQKLTLIDYPGKLAATVFLAGCNFRCPWCYSSELVLPEKIKKQPKISEADFFNFLGQSKGLIEGVVICGGEPTINKDLKDFAKKIKEKGYLVKLDTNGSNPSAIKQLIDEKLVDYIAMDIKAPKNKYEEAVGVKVNIKDVEKSIDLIMGLSLDKDKNDFEYEFRTTMVPELVEKEDILAISRWISGAEKFYIQNFRPEKNINSKYESLKPFPDDYLLETVKAVSSFFGTCQLR